MLRKPLTHAEAIIRWASLGSNREGDASSALSSQSATAFQQSQTLRHHHEICKGGAGGASSVYVAGVEGPEQGCSDLGQEPWNGRKAVGNTAKTSPRCREEWRDEVEVRINFPPGPFPPLVLALALGQT